MDVSILEVFLKKYQPAKGYPDADDFMSSEDILLSMTAHEPELFFPTEEVLVKENKEKNKGVPPFERSEVDLGNKITHLNMWLEENGYKSEVLEGMKVVWLLKNVA